MQDEDFVAEKDDSGSPTDDSGGDDSDASDSGGEKEVNHSSPFAYNRGLLSIFSCSHT